MNIVIEKGIPIPPIQPMCLTNIFRLMDINDSILLPVAKASSVHSCARAAGVKVQKRYVSNGLRVWRVA